MAHTASLVTRPNSVVGKVALSGILLSKAASDRSFIIKSAVSASVALTNFLLSSTVSVRSTKGTPPKILQSSK